LKNVAPPYSNAQEVFSTSSNKECHSPKSSKKPKYNIQSLANKLKDIEELIFDANNDEIEFSDN
jgi:hypothetical protein